MKDVLLTTGSIIIAAVLVLGAVKYHSGPAAKLSDKTNTTMLATVNAIEFAYQNSFNNRTIIDMRTPAEFKEGHIEGAINIDVTEPSFVSKLERLSKDTPYAIYCRSGNRSGQALNIMEKLGFTDVIDLKGGLLSWHEVGNELCVEC